MRARREFETSAALTVRLDRQILDRSGSPYGAKRRSTHGVARECIEGPFDIFLRQRTERPLQQYFLTVPDPNKREPWRSLLERNSTGILPAGVPVFLAQGTVDQIIRPAVTRAYMSKLCKSGSSVKTVVLPNIGHGRAAQASTMAAVNWMTDRLTGKAAPNDCGG
jgi:pimeloyl-ACP methyl ester carboxylesterase